MSGPTYMRQSRRRSQSLNIGDMVWFEWQHAMASTTPAWCVFFSFVFPFVLLVNYFLVCTYNAHLEETTDSYYIIWIFQGLIPDVYQVLSGSCYTVWEP